MNPIVIFGAAEIAEVAWFYFKHDSPYDVAAFTVDGEYIKEDSKFGLPVIPFEEIEQSFPPDAHGAFVAISYTKLNAIRAEKCEAVKAKGYGLVSYISSKATTWPDLHHGENCFIFEDNTIQPFVTIGNNVTLWSGNHIGHHARIGDNCFITSHVVISGAVTIGENTFIGVNSTLRDHVQIGRYNVIGAGSVILGDTPDDAVFSPKATEMSRVPSHRLKKI